MKIKFKFNKDVVCKKYKGRFSVKYVDPFSVKGLVEISNKCLINNTLLVI